MAVWKFCFQNRLSNPVINSPCRCEHITFKHHPSKCSKWVARLLMWLQRDNTTTSFIAAITILRFGGRLYFSFDVDILVLSYSVANCNPVTIYWCDNYYNLKNMDSVQFSCSIMSDSLRPHESQHARPPCPSQTPGVYSNSCPLSRLCHTAISSSVVPFSSRPQSFPASGSFPTSQLFASGGQSIGVSASASVLPMNTQDWYPSGWTGWISLQSKGLSRIFSNTTVQKHQFFGAQLSSQSNSHIHT